MAKVGPIFGSIISAVLALYFIGNLAGGAVSSIVNANTTGWGASNIALWTVCGLVAVVAFIYMVLRAAGLKV